MAEEIPSSELNRHPGALIDRAAAGEVFRITKRGTVIAVLGPPNTSTSSSTTAQVQITGDTQMTATDASHPSRRPVPESTPQQAEAKQPFKSQMGLSKKQQAKGQYDR